MAISGTGTQADPYIVTTIGEVLEKVAEADAYVCLANDIYVKEDVDYREGNTVPIIINCAKFYSTNSGGNYKSIIGYRCIASATYNFNIITIGANTSVDHVGFLSFFNDRTSETVDSNYCDLYCDDSSTVTNCNFSMFIKSSFAKNATLLHGKWESCSFYFDYNGSLTSSGNVENLINPYTNTSDYTVQQGMNKCFIYINNLVRSNWSIENTRLFTGMWNSTIYVKNFDVNHVGMSGYWVNSYMLDQTCRNSILDFHMTYHEAVAFSDWQGFAVTGYNCLYYCNRTRQDTITNGSIRATEAQLRDQQFLLDNGFV